MPREEFALRDFYDVWLPELAPSEELVKLALHARNERDWQAFAKRYRSEMKRPQAIRLVDLLVALSRVTAIAVGCYCVDEARCHRSVLKGILTERGAYLA